jgi:hypothetical protein
MMAKIAWVAGILVVIVGLGFFLHSRHDWPFTVWPFAGPYDDSPVVVSGGSIDLFANNTKIGNFTWKALNCPGTADPNVDKCWYVSQPATDITIIELDGVQQTPPMTPWTIGGDWTIKIRPPVSALSTKPSDTTEDDSADVLLCSSADAVSCGLVPAGSSGYVIAKVETSGTHDVGFYKGGTPNKKQFDDATGHGVEKLRGIEVDVNGKAPVIFDCKTYDARDCFVSINPQP